MDLISNHRNILFLFFWDQQPEYDDLKSVVWDSEVLQVIHISWNVTANYIYQHQIWTQRISKSKLINFHILDLIWGNFEAAQSDQNEL